MKTTKEQAIKERCRIKGKKPEFRRQESWRYKRVKDRWRKARGIDSKMRRKVKGWPSSPSVGYRGPKKARHLHPSGSMEVLVHNADEVEKVDPQTEAIRIAHTVGAKKRIDILTRAEEKGIRILNPAREKAVEEEELRGRSEVAEPAEEGVEED